MSEAQVQDLVRKFDRGELTRDDFVRRVTAIHDIENTSPSTRERVLWILGEAPRVARTVAVVGKLATSQLAVFLAGVVVGGAVVVLWITSVLDA